MLSILLIELRNCRLDYVKVRFPFERSKTILPRKESFDMSWRRYAAIYRYFARGEYICPCVSRFRNTFSYDRYALHSSYCTLSMHFSSKQLSVWPLSWCILKYSLNRGEFSYQCSSVRGSINLMAIVYKNRNLFINLHGIYFAFL